MKNILLLFSFALLISSCETSRRGCTDPNAVNYESFADYDDGSCLYTIGCTDPTAINYDPQAILDDGSCLYISGCTDPTAINYDPQAGLEPLNGCDYSCEIVWYLTESASDFMLGWGIYSYHFYLKNENLSFGSIANNYWFYPNNPPDCQYQPNATLVQTFYWSGNYENSAAVVEWEAWADDGTNILILDYEDADVVYPNDCLTIGLTGNKLKAYKEENKEKKRKERAK